MITRLLWRLPPWAHDAIWAITGWRLVNRHLTGVNGMTPCEVRWLYHRRRRL